MQTLSQSHSQPCCEPYWAHGDRSFYLGDCLTVLPQLAEGSAQLIVTSPPYFNAKGYAQWDTYEAYLADMARVWVECHRILCWGGRIAVNVLHGYDRRPYLPVGCDLTKQLEQHFLLRGHVIWNKMGLGNQNGGTAWGSWCSASNPFLRDGHEIVIVASKGAYGREPGQSDLTADEFTTFTRSVWNVRPETGSEHPAPFPESLAVRLIKLYSYVGDTIVDPFVGSGTTVRVAANLRRKGIGIDIRQDYLEMAIGRCCQESLALEV